MRCIFDIRALAGHGTGIDKGNIARLAEAFRRFANSPHGVRKAAQILKH